MITKKKHRGKDKRQSNKVYLKLDLATECLNKRNGIDDLIKVCILILKNDIESAREWNILYHVTVTA